MKHTKQVIPLASLVAIAAIQCREVIDKDALESYKATALDSFGKGAKSPFPPLKVVKEGEQFLLAAGFSRNKALAAAGYTETECEVFDGTKDDAFLIGLESNLAHGSRLTTEDCVRALKRLLDIDENLSNVELGKRIGRSENFVRRNRPASKDTGKRVITKNGKKVEVKVGNTGKGKTEAGKAAKAKKEEVKKAKKAEKASGAPAAKSGKASEPQESKIDTEYEKALLKVTSAIDGKGFVGTAVRKAIEDGSLPLSKSDVKFWALRAADRILKVAPLIIENRWSPKRAFAFIDQVVDAKTKAEDLINLAVAGGGIVLQKLDGYAIYVVDESKFELTRNYQTGTHGIAPKSAK